MANGKYMRGRKEQKIVDLLSEYGTLQINQMEQFFCFDDDIHIPLFNVMKRGRAIILEDEGLVKAHKDISTDHVLLKCFWVVVDLAEDIEHHFRATYPMILTFYSKGDVYELYYCAKGDELVVTHAIRQREAQEMEKRDIVQEEESPIVKQIIVIEEESQMERIDMSDAVFCMIGENGEVAYYE